MKKLYHLKLIHAIRAFEIALGISIDTVFLVLFFTFDVIDRAILRMCSGFINFFIIYISFGEDVSAILISIIWAHFNYYCFARAKMYREKRHTAIIWDRAVIWIFALDLMLALQAWRQTEELMVFPIYGAIFDCIVIIFFALTMRYRKVYSKK